MKELSIEEKAKAYDEALKVLHKYDGAHIMFTQDLKEEMFPELKESEDERIREKVIATIHLYYGEPLEDEAKEMIAWLEKQGEHANFRNKIQIGDKVTRNEDGVLVNLSQLNRVAKKQGENNMGISEATKKKLEDNLNNALEKETPESCNEFLDKQCEQNPAWSLPYEKNETVEKIIALAECLEMDGDCLFNGLSGNDYGKFLRVLAIELTKVKPAAWSEEDETKLKSACALIRNTSLNGNEDVIDSTITFLKSLKDRPIQRQARCYR